MVVDCGAIPATLIESELFGHERGAFTGATETRRGAFEAARGGTLFLDEIGELPPAVQPMLLRVLEDRTVKRVGDDRRIAIDVRVVAATNRDLREEVNRSRFRADLYYRLAVLRLRVPPLRERREDIPLLVRHFCEHLRRRGREARGRAAARLVAVGRAHHRAVGPELAGQRARAAQRGAARAPPGRRGRVAGSAGVAAPDALVDVSQTYGDAKEEATARWEAAYVQRADRDVRRQPGPRRARGRHEPHAPPQARRALRPARVARPVGAREVASGEATSRPAPPRPPAWFRAVPGRAGRPCGCNSLRSTATGAGS